MNVVSCLFVCLSCAEPVYVKDGHSGHHRRGWPGVRGISHHSNSVEQQPKRFCQFHQHHLFPLLSTLSVCRCRLLSCLHLHLPLMYGGKHPGVSDSAGKPMHAHSHKLVHPQPGDQWPTGWDLLHSYNAGGQPHHR